MDMIQILNVANATGRTLIPDIIDCRRSTMFGLMLRLKDNTPAHSALQLVTDVLERIPPSLSWRNLCGQAGDTWVKVRLQTLVLVNRE